MAVCPRNKTYRIGGKTYRAGDEMPDPKPATTQKQNTAKDAPEAKEATTKKGGK